MGRIKLIIVKVRSSILVLLTHKIALPLLKIFRRPVTFPFTEQELSKLPAGTLGNDLYVFLKERNLPLLKHYYRHDLKHILLSYDTTDKGEACLQCFMLGNGRLSFPVIATVLYSMLTMPEYWQEMKIAFKKGRKISSVHDLPWQNLLVEKTIDIKREIFKQRSNQ
jgi:ubiquinone biosynthesis protein Coq4